MTVASLISVVMPVWNGARYLGEALSSIRAQKYAPLEILVVDDGSTDETPEIAARPEFGVRYLPFPHRGLAATRLAGIAAAQGEIIASLDSDDLWAPNKLEIQLRLLRDNPQAMIVNGYTQLIRPVDAQAAVPQFENWGAPILAASFGSALIRREAIPLLGLEQLRHSSNHDVDYFLPARERNIPMLTHTDTVQYYRRHSTNMTNDQETEKKVTLLRLKESLDRRQAAGKLGVSLPTLDVAANKPSEEQA